MLTSLDIKNIAVIEHAVFDPKSGLNVITGETGAGKSLLIDSISLILGSKASRELIRSGAEEANVEAVFDYSNSSLRENISSFLNSNGIDEDENCQLIISRRITTDGKSYAKINGHTQIIGRLKELSIMLIDIHGQHDTQKIFDEDSHIYMLDSFAGDEVSECLQEYRAGLSRYKDIVVKIKNLSMNPDDIKRRKSELQETIEEISTASFKDDEEEKLQSRFKALKLFETSGELLDEINQLINGEDDSGLTTVSRFNMASSVAGNLSKTSDEYISFAQKINEIAVEVESISSDISKLYNSIDYDKNDAEMVVERLNLLNTLLVKYNCKNVRELNLYLEKSKHELISMEDIGQLLNDLRKQRSIVETEVLNLGEKLTDLRKVKAKELSNLIEQELNDLEFTGAVFKVEFTRREKNKFFSKLGIDDVKFLFSANPGQEAKSLASIASGGEASRIMLAIKTILSEADNTDTLIFDEIDSGVSGKAATSIANKLKRIAKKHQVLCITHTAQVAAASDSGYLLSKEILENKTSTVLTALNSEAKVNEVSRLLSGTTTAESVELANKLIGSFS